MHIYSVGSVISTEMMLHMQGIYEILVTKPNFELTIPGLELRWSPI